MITLMAEKTTAGLICENLGVILSMMLIIVFHKYIKFINFNNKIREKSMEIIHKIKINTFQLLNRFQVYNSPSNPK